MSKSVFISHSTGDRAFVETVLLPILSTAGIESWYSPRDIRTSDDWEQSIRRGLESSDWFLLVMSPRAQSSEWVRDEVLWAVEHRPGRIVPVLAETCDPRNIHMRLARIQHVDFRGDREGALRRLLAALGMNRDEPSGQSVPKVVSACRIMPFFLGRGPAVDCGEQMGLPAFQCGDARVLLMDDCFAVSLVREEVSFSDPVDFLLQRRERHLDLLSPDSPLLASLKGYQSDPLEHPILATPPRTLPYVMSVHRADTDRAALSEVELTCLAEPSILGISDDPHDLVTESRIEEAGHHLKSCAAASESIEVIRGAQDRYLVSWANVVLVTHGGGDEAFEHLIRTEVLLQGLWYRMHLYSDAMEGLLDRADTADLAAVRREVLKTKMQYTQYCRLDPTGATHLNALRSSLIRTSRLRELYEEFILRTGLVDDLEALL